MRTYEHPRYEGIFEIDTPEAVRGCTRYVVHSIECVDTVRRASSPAPYRVGDAVDGFTVSEQRTRRAFAKSLVAEDDEPQPTPPYFWLDTGLWVETAVYKALSAYTAALRTAARAEVGGQLAMKLRKRESQRQEGEI
jgi:hypothetical protein